MLNYKSYTGSIEISVEDGVLHGSVLDIKDVITFEGTTIEEVKQAFQDSVDDYRDSITVWLNTRTRQKNANFLDDIDFQLRTRMRTMKHGIDPIQRDSNP